MNTRDLTPREQGELRDVLLHSPIVQKARREVRERFAAARKAAAEAVAAIVAKFERDWPKAQAAYEKADAEYHEAFQAFRAADEARRQAYRDRADVDNLAEVAKRPHLKVLAETAPKE